MMLSWLGKGGLRAAPSAVVWQNDQAALYLRDFVTNANEAGYGADTGLLAIFDGFRQETANAWNGLRQGGFAKESYERQRAINAELRAIFDQTAGPRAAFAECTVLPEPTQDFDRIFRPSNGWLQFLWKIRRAEGKLK